MKTTVRKLTEVECFQDYMEYRDYIAEYLNEPGQKLHPMTFDQYKAAYCQQPMECAV